MPQEPSATPPLTIVNAIEAEPIEWSAGLPTLFTDVAMLREPRLSDAGALFENLATDQVARFMSRPPGNAGGFERFITWIQSERRQGRCLCYGIVPPGHDHAVGLIQVRQLEPGFGSAEWGFALGQRYWGTGIFQAGARAAVDFVFRFAGAYRLEARSSTENGRGNGALRKLGATAEGMLRQSLLGAARPMDQLLWSMHSDEWLRVHHASPYQVGEPSLDSESAEPLVLGPPPPTVLPEWRRGLPTMVTDECTLRDLKQADAPELLRHLHHPDVGRYIPPSPATVDAFEQFIAWAHRQREGGRYACFGVVPNGYRDAVGIFQLRQLDPSFLSAEWGFVLGKQFWGSGIFLSAAAPVLDFAFNTIGVHRLEARAATGNNRGNGALKKVGAVLEGQLRRSFLLGGVYHDDALWALLADDWRKLRNEMDLPSTGTP